MSSQYLEVARGLRSLIDANAEKAGSDPRRRPLAAAGLFGVMTPREVGGALIQCVCPDRSTRSEMASRASVEQSS